MSETKLNFDLSMKGPIAFFATLVIVVVYTSGNLVTSSNMSTFEFFWLTVFVVIISSLAVFGLAWYGKTQFEKAVKSLAERKLAAREI